MTRIINKITIRNRNLFFINLQVDIIFLESALWVLLYLK